MNERIAARVSAWVAGVSIVVLAACGSDAPGPPAGLLAIDPGAAGTWETVPAFQRDLLADGELSFADYERAAYEYVGCMTSQGYTVDPPPHLDVSGKRLTWEFTSGGTDEELAAFATDDADCSERYFSYIQYLWSQKTAPSAEEQHAAEEVLHACMLEAGHEMPFLNDSIAFEAWLAKGIPPEFKDCLEQTQKETGVPLFG